jgi:hypothetical protein
MLIGPSKPRGSFCLRWFRSGTNSIYACKEAQAMALEKVFPQRDQLESVKTMLVEAEQDAERTARLMPGRN